MNYISNQNYKYMQLNEILKDLPKPKHEDVLLHAVHGLITSDHDSDYIRLYTDPANPTGYILIKKADVIGEIYKWKTEELTEFAFIGKEMYTLNVKSGTQVQTVKITLQRYGETISGDVINSPNASGKQDCGDCKTTSLCPANGGCCKQGNPSCVCDDCCH